MTMFSAFMNFIVVDGQGRKFRLSDVAIALADHEYPPTTHVIFRDPEKKKIKIAWDAVRSVHWESNQIEITNLDASEAVSADSKEDVLLKRDVLDSLILDLERRQATRANDLWLEEKGRTLVLKAVDTSASAVLRRLSRGRLGGKSSESLCDWKYVEFLRGDPLGVKSGATYHMRIGLLPPGEIAGLSNSLPYLHAAELLTLLPDPLAAKTLEFMQIERQIQVFGTLEEGQALRLLTLMTPDSAVDLLGHHSPEAMKSYLERLPKNRTDLLVDLLRYPYDTAGGIMTNDIVTVPVDLTVKEARETLRNRLKESEFSYLIYVVENDETRILRGITSLRDILMADDHEQLEDVMKPYVSTISPFELASSAAYRVLDSHIAALPVIGDKGRILGIVTVDAAVDQVAPQGWRTQAPKVFS